MSKCPIKRWKDTTVGLPELYKYLAFNFLMSHTKKCTIDDCWSTNELDKTPIFPRVMLKHRYLLILQMFHLNCNSLQESGDRLHKLAPVLLTVLKKSKLCIIYMNLYVYFDESIVKWKSTIFGRVWASNFYCHSFMSFTTLLEQGL